MPPQDAPRFAENEPNDELFSPTVLPPDSLEGFFLEARLSSNVDVDIFDLGPAEKGHRVSLRLTATEGTYLKVALLDETGDALVVTQAPPGGEQEISLAHVVRQDTAAVLLAVAPLGPRTNAIGRYETAVAGREVATIPAPQPQFLHLNFGGADLSGVLDLNRFDAVPFDAADIDPSYTGLTPYIIDAMVNRVADVFAGSNVTVVTTVAGLDPAKVSTVHVGAVGESVLGLAQSVDAYNTDHGDHAVVFTMAFRQFMYLSPTADEMATALANVVCHEAGHLLGLNHTQGNSSLMDITSSMSVLLKQRYFGEFPLERSALPLGFQNAPELLRQTVGGELLTTTSHQEEGPSAPGTDDPDDQGRPLPVWHCTDDHNLVP
jgi:hypothetical protein